MAGIAAQGPSCFGLACLPGGTGSETETETETEKDQQANLLELTLAKSIFLCRAAKEAAWSFLICSAPFARCLDDNTKREECNVLRCLILGAAEDGAPMHAACHPCFMPCEACTCPYFMP